MPRAEQVALGGEQKLLSTVDGSRGTTVLKSNPSPRPTCVTTDQTLNSPSVRVHVGSAVFTECLPYVVDPSSSA